MTSNHSINCYFNNSESKLRIYKYCNPIGKLSNWAKKVCSKELIFELILKFKNRKTNNMAVPMMLSSENWTDSTPNQFWTVLFSYMAIQWVIDTKMSNIIKYLWFLGWFFFTFFMSSNFMNYDYSIYVEWVS